MSIRQPSKVAKYCKQNELHEGRGASRHETNAWTGRWTADGPARTGPSELRRLTRLESHVIDTVSYRVLVISGFWTGFLDGILQDSRSLSLQAATCILHAATACPPSSERAYVEVAHLSTRTDHYPYKLHPHRGSERYTPPTGDEVRNHDPLYRYTGQDIKAASTYDARLSLPPCDV
eukprot:156743-Prymnesium_polylepis.3